jgi:hypothetical protein
VYIYKTAHHPRFERDYKEKVVDIALATAAAPTYFPTQRSAAGTPLLDGGMWANNPVGLAVVEAIGVLGWAPTSLHVLSLGCTKEPMNVNRGRRLALGSAYWVGKITSVFMAAQSSSSLGTASILVGHENIVRINPYVARGRFGLDAIKEAPSLRGLGDSEARDALPALRPMFFAAHAEPFEPVWKLDK